MEIDLKTDGRRRTILLKRATASILTSSIHGALLLFLIGCGNVAQEKRLIGSWKIEAKAPGELTYTYNQNHTFVADHVWKNRKLQERGIWRLEGSSLTLETTTHPNGDPITPPIRVEVTITELNDSTMVWKSALLARSARLKRVDMQ